MRPLPIPIGIDDFRKLRELRLEYIDKSDLIQKLIDRPGVEVSLFPRPRRFGKSLNLSMLRCWFEKRDDDLSHLFEGLSIWQAGDAYRAHFQRYPVIFLSFKETKSSSFDRVMAAFRLKIQSLYHDHRHLLESDRLTEWQRRDIRAILDGDAEPALYERALINLSEYLHAHSGEQVILLIDEYDEPIHAGYMHGFTQEILDFMRAFLGGALKGNPHLSRAVLTGILRVAKENLFSGLNNLGVYSLIRRNYNTCFGFTEAEVAALLERCGRADKLEEVRTWYNGYLFGGEVIYNPWSILCYLDDGGARLLPYWLSTSSNDLVKELIELNAFSLQPIFQELLEGGSIERLLEENVVLSEIRQSPDALWSLLVFSGYLRAEERPMGRGEQSLHALSIPNREVRAVYSGTFRRWMAARMEGHGGSVDRLTRALLGGDVDELEEQLQAFVSNVLSYHDTAGLGPERVYQSFVVGLLAVLEPGHDVRSNRESGGGRPDILIRPRQPNKPGVALELKVARRGKKTLEQALAEGLAQLHAMDYEAELRAAGASPVIGMAVAFDGKKVRVAGAAGREGARRRGAEPGARQRAASAAKSKPAAGKGAAVKKAARAAKRVEARR